MEVQKLSTTDAFVVWDLGPDVPAAGVVRLAPKILVDGAVLLARSTTYAFASFERRWGGLSAGVNAGPDQRSGALSAFVDEVAPQIAGGSTIEAGKGVGAADLAALAEAGGALHREHGDGLRGLGAAICADAAVGLDGKAVVIEGFDGSGPDLVRAVYDRGGRVVAVNTAKGCVMHPKGIDPAMLTQAWREHGAAMVEHVDVLNQPAAMLWSVEADIVCCGSKTGVIDHDLAVGLTAKALVPTGPAPVTAKALAVLRKAGVTVLPDFITTAAPLFAIGAGEDATVDSVRGAASVGLLGALGEVLDDEQGPVLGACRRAEAFLLTWQAALPAFRPLA